MNNETLGEVVAFLTKHHKRHILLSQGKSMVVVSPDLAGRLIATSSEGIHGRNPSFTKLDAITKPNLEKAYDPEGGDRWWIIPEGQRNWSFYLPVGTVDFRMENLNKVWRVPPSFDKAAFIVDEQDKDKVSLRAYVNATNVKGNLFELAVYLHYELVQPPDYIKDKGFAHVGYKRSIIFENIGRNIWDDDYGMIAPWSLSMLKSGKKTWIVLPVKEGTIDQVVDYRMSGSNQDRKVPGTRFLKRHNYGLLKADGRYRGKLGLRPNISRESIASIDLVNGLLMVMNVPRESGRYIDNRWVPEGKFNGTMIDCYNDSGSIAGGGPVSMYELEGVAPVHIQRPGNQNVLTVTVRQFKADPSNIEILYSILNQMTGVDLTRENYKGM